MGLKSPQNLMNIAFIYIYYYYINMLNKVSILIKRLLIFTILFFFIGFNLFSDEDINIVDINIVIEEDQVQEEILITEEAPVLEDYPIVRNYPVMGKKHKYPSIFLIFYELHWNLLHTLTYNNGLTLVGMGVSTWAFIDLGIDWYWRNIGYTNKWIADSGYPFHYIGFVIPIVAPVITYLSGVIAKDDKLQIAGMALIQALAITSLFQASLKMITDRTLPGIVDRADGHIRNKSNRDFSGEFNWFSTNIMNGWPSGHTANAVAAAVVLSEIYSDNIWLKIGVYTYAAVMGFGVSLDAHWMSDVVAGALLGWAIGKTVAKSFKKLLERENKEKKNYDLSFYVHPNGLGVIIKL